MRQGNSVSTVASVLTIIPLNSIQYIETNDIHLFLDLPTLQRKLHLIQSVFYNKKYVIALKLIEVNGNTVNIRWRSQNLYQYSSSFTPRRLLL